MAILATSLLISFLTIGCGRLALSPFERSLNRDERATTAMNLRRLEGLGDSREAFSFAVVADTHQFYGDLRRVVDAVNSERISTDMRSAP